MTFTDSYTLDIAHTQDEDGKDRWFLEDSNGDWPYGPYDSREEALENLKAYNAGKEIAQ